MAAVSLFWDTKMAAVTSCESTKAHVNDVIICVNGIIKYGQQSRRTFHLPHLALKRDPGIDVEEGPLLKVSGFHCKVWHILLTLVENLLNNNCIINFLNNFNIKPLSPFILDQSSLSTPPANHEQ